MEKISFELFGLTLLEPLSTLMNWVLAAQCAFYYRKLKGTGLPGPFVKYWTWFFAGYAVSLVFGGLSHLLFHYVGMPGKIPGWSCALLANVAGEMATIAHIRDPKRRALLLTVIRSKLFASVALLAWDFSFKWVMVHTAGLFFFLIIISLHQLKRGAEGYKYFLIGLSSLSVLAFVKVAQLDIHPSWFTRDDIAHFLMLGMYWMFYKAVIAVGRKNDR